MIYKFSCPNLTAKILELEDCWNYIPIQGGGFVIPQTLHTSFQQGSLQPILPFDSVDH